MFEVREALIPYSWVVVPTKIMEGTFGGGVGGDRGRNQEIVLVQGKGNNLSWAKFCANREQCESRIPLGCISPSGIRTLTDCAHWPKKVSNVTAPYAIMDTAWYSWADLSFFYYCIGITLCAAYSPWSCGPVGGIDRSVTFFMTKCWLCVLRKNNLVPVWIMQNLPPPPLRPNVNTRWDLIRTKLKQKGTLRTAERAVTVIDPVHVSREESESEGERAL